MRDRSKRQSDVVDVGKRYNLTRKQLSLVNKYFSDPQPTKFQLSLLNIDFMHGVNQKLDFYVVEVKRYEPFKQVCCFSIPYDGNVAKALKLYDELHKSNKEIELIEETIFDCRYVRKYSLLSSSNVDDAMVMMAIAMVIAMALLHSVM